MKHEKRGGNFRARHMRRLILLLQFSGLLNLCRAAEDFGDVSVSANALFTGNTYHGYAEMRVALENHSPTKSHRVTLIYPNHAYGSGNTISRLTRTVSLGPDAREEVPLLQPPLPVQGDGSIGVEVDGRNEGEIRAPNANNHCNPSYSGVEPTAAVLVSRSLDYDAVARIYQANNAGAFTAAKAVGPPDAGGSGYQANAWMPDTRVAGADNWLELDYAMPQLVNKIVVYRPRLAGGAGRLELLGVAGTKVASLPLTAGRNFSTGPGWQSEYSLPVTGVAVKKVRLDFDRSSPGMIAIDAVQISGPTGSQWASDASASSDNNANSAAYLPRHANEESIESLRAESPVSEWSGNWLAYSPFDAVVLSAADVAALTPAVFAALGDYVQAGGNLVVLGRRDLPVSWHAAQVEPLYDGAEFRMGFGNVLALGPENTASFKEPVRLRLREAARENARYYRNLPGDGGAANAVMAVVADLKIPVRGIVIIMLVFVVIIGPVNLYYLNRIKRRTWMLWTIPAISFVTTLLVFGYSLLREGITPDTRIAGLTVLDQTSHQAATIGGEAFYCPLTPSGGLHFELGTEATPLVSRGYGSGTAREVDWTQAQNFPRGWVSARVPAHFHLRKSETRRERIQVLNENGKLQVVNSLGAPIQSLWFADADLNLYQAGHVGAGEKGGLIPGKSPGSPQKQGAAGMLRDLGFAGSQHPLGDEAGKYLLQNSYVAVLDGNPFLENALAPAASAKRTRISCVVFGILEVENK